MTIKKLLRYLSALAVVAVAVYFFYLQFQKNAGAIRTWDFSINPVEMSLAVIFGSCALLIGPVVWRIFVNSYLTEKLNYTESFALYCTSAIFKYIPGKIWTYAAQIALLSSKGIANVTLLYINLVSFICLFFVTALFSFYYYFIYVREMSLHATLPIFMLFLMMDAVFIIGNHTIINYLIRPVNRLFNLNIKPIHTKKTTFIQVQMLYALACVFLGIALYFLARGVNMPLSFSHIFAMMATISVSLILGLLAFFTMGGLGVREGAMFFMLKQFATIEAALILPVISRLLITAVELLMGLMGIMIGMKYHYFSQWEKYRQNDILEEETQTETL